MSKQLVFRKSTELCRTVNMIGRRRNKSQSVPLTRRINCFVNSEFYFNYSKSQFFVTSRFSIMLCCTVNIIGRMRNKSESVPMARCINLLLPQGFQPGRSFCLMVG